MATKNTWTELKNRIEALEAENHELKLEIKRLKATKEGYLMLKKDFDALQKIEEAHV